MAKNYILWTIVILAVAFFLLNNAGASKVNKMITKCGYQKFGDWTEQEQRQCLSTHIKTIDTCLIKKTLQQGIPCKIWEDCPSQELTKEQIEANRKVIECYKSS